MNQSVDLNTLVAQEILIGERLDELAEDIGKVRSAIAEAKSRRAKDGLRKLEAMLMSSIKYLELERRGMSAS